MTNTILAMEYAAKIYREAREERMNKPDQALCPNCVSPWKCNGPHIPEDNELAALRAELTEQCRLNAMGSEREARLMAQLQEAERKLAELMKEGGG